MEAALDQVYVGVIKDGVVWHVMNVNYENFWLLVKTGDMLVTQDCIYWGIVKQVLFKYKFLEAIVETFNSSSIF